MYLLLSQSEIDDLHENARVYTKQSLHALQEMYESLTNDISNLVVAPGADQMNSEDIALGAVSLCHGNFFNPTRQVLDDTGSGSCEHAVNAQQETVNSLWSSEELSERVVNLNKGQRYIFDHVISEIIHGENTLRLFITGGAGSGKTFVLHAINEAVSRYFNLQPSNIPSIKSVMKVAITGKAAFLIKGETIHSGLGIRPKKCYEFYERLSADQLNSLHVKFRGTKLLMIDEISMVGLNFFRFINARLQDIMANDEPFGGLNIICFGDLYQLPPVHDKWIFDDNENGLSSLEINMWKEHFMLYELKEIMRQRDEYEFAELLNRMRVGQMIPSDFDCLQRQAVPVHVSNDNLDCLHLFSTNDAATDYNQICFNKSDGEKEQVLAVDSIVEVVTPHVKSLVIAELNKTNMRSGVLRCLDLAIGLTYEITQNLNVQDGLFNGTSGILKFIQYREGYEKPIALWLELEEEMIGQTQRRIYSHYRTPEIPNLWTPVFAVSREFKIKDPKVTIRRKQFPIHQCTGKTIHRAQGCTVPEIAIQLSDFTHRNGFYVACSRVPKLRNLHILNFAPNQILTEKKVGHEMERLRTERLLNLEVDIYPRKDMWFSVYYCNVQSLIRHISYVRRDFMALSSNLILFNETHLTNDDSDFLVNIDGFKIYRFDCEVTDTGRRPYNGLVLYIKSVMKVAITGKAAFLIKGETIHSGLGIRPKKCYEFYERLSADQLNSLHVKFRGTKLLMIDEISMVGLNFFRFINARLQDIMANDEPFGGLNIICFGDLYQLPPVHDKWIFDDNENGLSSLEINMWKEHFMLYELKEIMRQRDEYEFAELLNRMRVGQMIPSDFDCLQRQAVPVHVSNDNLDCLHLFSTNDAATDYNQICFNKSDGEKEQVLAVDSIVEVVTPHVKSLVIAELNKTNMRSGVLRCLDLAIGLTYEITQNLNVQDGLFNGTSGILKFIQYREGYEKPIALWLELEEEMIGQTQRRIYSHYRTPEIPNLWTPVFAVSREFKIKDPKVTIRRKQFPIHQCTGKTIHRAQGCTVPEIAIQLSDFTHRNGFYVACSRVPKLRNLHILNFAPNQILTDKKVGHEMERLRTERLLNLEVDIYPRKDMWFSVYYCNVQSLIRHISYVRRDFMALSSNLILFNETHLTNDDSDFLVNIDGFKIYRFDCEVTDTGRRPYNGLVLYTRCFFDVNVVTKYRSERFEYLCCEIVTNWNKLTVVLVYVKPPASRADLTNMFEHIFQNDLDFNRNIALIGDLNFNTLIPENFSFLHDLAEDYNLMLNHTTITTNKGTIIDHCLSNNPSSVSCRFIPWSYHNALTCQF